MNDDLMELARRLLLGTATRADALRYVRDRQPVQVRPWVVSRHLPRIQTPDSDVLLRPVSHQDRTQRST